jgi:dTDP-4-amino-4,6-dideoxygalactose transaminase
VKVPIDTRNETASARERSQFLPFALPDITTAEIDAVVEVLTSGWLTTGPRVHEFERAFAEYLGVAYAKAFNSGTAALHLALEAIGLTRDHEVIVPTYTFAASAEVVRYFGATPVLVDVKKEDLNVDVEAVKRAITANTRAVIGVDIAGQPCDWDLLRQVSKDRGLVLIDDAAHALPSRLLGRRIGAWADLTAFSFYATKPLTTGEGGMLVTENRDWADRAQLMGLHGIAHDAWNRYRQDGSWYYEVLAPGYKYNLTDLAAAMGLVQLRRLDQMTARRASIADKYTAAFSSFAEFETPIVGRGRETSWHLYLLRLNLERLPYDRRQFIEALAKLNIGTSVHFIPLHMQPYYQRTYGYEPEDFPIACQEYERVVSLPIYSRMSDRDVDDVIAAISRVIETHA